MDTMQYFIKFISENINNAHKFAYIYVKNTKDAEDVVSDSIEKALLRLHTLKDPGRMKAWFYKIIINTSINHIRKHSRTVLTSNNAPVFYFDDLSRLEFDDLLNMFSEVDRRIVLLRFYENRSIKDIADALGMKENTVKTRLYRAIRKLRLEIINEPNGVAVKTLTGKDTAKKLLLFPAALIVSAICAFNVIPSLAEAAHDIPILGNMVKIITINKYRYKNKNFEAEIIVPKINGLLDAQLQEKLNDDFGSFADEIILAFNATVSVLEELDAEPPESPPAHMSVKADYTVKTDSEKVLSIDSYLFSDVNNYVVHKFCTIDKTTGKYVELKDLFSSGSDYISPISEYIVNEMKRLNYEEDATFQVDGTLFDAFTQIKADHNFYINGDGMLVICFDKYEVAAGYQGSPEFVIPWDVISAIASSGLIIK